MSKLEEICKYKILEIEELKKKYNYTRNTKKHSNFLKTLTEFNKTNFNVIAEIKKRSPSHGLIVNNFNPVEIAEKYKKAGAKCLSVLTEKKYFEGDIKFIPLIKEKVDIPILRKDFIIDEWQIYESSYFKADCILLIFSILDDDQIARFYKIAKDLGMDVICEIHNSLELQRAVNLNVDCIGINNRDLKTLKINLDNFRKLVKKIPKGFLKICESGLKTNKQIKQMSLCGADAFLIGESLMKSNNIYKNTFEMIKK